VKDLEDYACQKQGTDWAKLMNLNSKPEPPKKTPDRFTYELGTEAAQLSVIDNAENNYDAIGDYFDNALGNRNNESLKMASESGSHENRTPKLGRLRSSSMEESEERT
jgi:hypothetical protein